MAKRAGMFKSEKRKKELIRQKKQEENRLRRQKNAGTTPENPETSAPMNDRES